MSDWHNERSDVQFYIEQAQEARAEAMTRVGYLAVATVGRAVGAVAGRARAALGTLAAWRDRQVACTSCCCSTIACCGTSASRVLMPGLPSTARWAAVQDWPPEPTAYFDIALSGARRLVAITSNLRTWLERGSGTGLVCPANYGRRSDAVSASSQSRKAASGRRRCVLARLSR